MAETIKIERVDELAYIVGIVQQRSVGLKVGFGNARPVRREDTETVAQSLSVEKMPLQPGAGHAMTEHQRIACRVTQIGVGKLATVT
jgi:hypothetical protein